METKRFNFSGRELPSHLGYGLLDQHSVKFENEVVKADYILECDGSVVHKVTWEPKRCELQTQLHGEFCGTSWYPDLNKALTYDFLSRQIDSDKVYDYLTRKTCGAGNIYVQKPKTADRNEKRIIYYPAGLLLSFILPLPEKDDTYETFLNGIKVDSSISLFRGKNGYLMFMDVHHQAEIHPIILAEFIVPLAYMTSAARIFAASGLIRPCKLLRMMVFESNSAESSFLQTFVGDSINPYFAYCFKEFAEEQHPNLLKMFEHMVNALNYKTPE